MEIPYLEFFEIAEYGWKSYVLWTFVSAELLILAYYFLFYSRLVFYKNPTQKVDPDPVSVIIASRDDAHFLKEHLPLIMEQKGVEYEVIVIDDCSLDDTSFILKEYADKYPNFKHSRLFENGDFEGGKKYAVTIGIKAAKHPHLVFIDADCYPNSDQWLRLMAERLMFKKVVVGYGPYQKTKGFLNMLIRYDTFRIAMQYLSYTLAGIPYMGVGRNMAYHSYLYFDVKGFTSHNNVVSGDDDLFVNEVSNRKNTGIQIDPDSYVYSIPKSRYTKWEFQKRRHLTTASKYRWYHKILLMLLPLAQYVMWGTLIVLLSTQFAPYLVLALVGIKLLFQGIIQFFVMRRLQVLDLFVFSFVLDFVLLLFYPWITFLNIVNEDQRKRWI